MEVVDKAVALVPGTSCDLETSNLHQSESTKPSSHGTYFYNSHLDQHYPPNATINDIGESAWRSRGCGSQYSNSKVEYAQTMSGNYADTNYYAGEVDQRQFYSSTAHLPEGSHYYNGGSYHHHYHSNQHQSNRHQHPWHQPLTSLDASSGSCTLHYNYNYCDQAQAQAQAQAQQQYQQQENTQKIRSIAYYQPPLPVQQHQQQQQYVQENYNHTYHHHHHHQQLQHQQSSSVCYDGRQNSSQATVAPQTYEQDHRRLTDFGARDCNATESTQPSPSAMDSRLSHHQVHLQVWLSAGCEQQSSTMSDIKSRANDCLASTTTVQTSNVSIVQDGTQPEVKSIHDDSPQQEHSPVTPLKPAKVPAVGKTLSRISTRSRVSTSPKINQCPVCKRNYARPSTLKTHLRTHTNERPFQCDVCRKTFSQAANLTAHQRVHTGERPFSCPICYRRFSQSSSVITHLRTHSGERPYRCGHCSRTFSDSSTLTKHCRIHSGEKPYQCDHCPLNFSQSGNLSRHMKLHQTRPNSANNSSSSSSSSGASSIGATSSSRPSSARSISTAKPKQDTTQIELNIQQ